MKNDKAVSTAILYGIPTAILLIILFHSILTGDEVYLGNDRVNFLLFSVVCAVYIVMFKNHFQKHTNNIPDLVHIAIIIMTFTFTVALCLGISHVINVSFIDPNWADNSLALLQEKWVANNLSKEAIAGQIELTDTFHNPFKWGAVLTIFFSILYSIPGCIIGMLYYFRHSYMQNPKPPSINYQ